ncbi:hypothetical protein VP01_1503g4, partial [Puccinia sorghi]
TAPPPLETSPKTLDFFLFPFSHRQATVKKLTRIIQYVYPDVEFKGTPGKPYLLQIFNESIAPLFAKGSQTSGKNPTPIESCDNLDVSHINIEQFDPHSHSSTKLILSALIRKINSTIATRQLNKASVIALFSKVYNWSPKKSRRKFSCYHPYLFIPVECGKAELLAIYKLFILGVSIHKDLVEENIHYFLFDQTILQEYVVSQSLS